MLGNVEKERVWMFLELLIYFWSEFQKKYLITFENLWVLALKKWNKKSWQKIKISFEWNPNRLLKGKKSWIKMQLFDFKNLPKKFQTSTFSRLLSHLIQLTILFPFIHFHLSTTLIIKLLFRNVSIFNKR